MAYALTRWAKASATRAGSPSEFRYALGPVTPFVFHDLGQSDTNANPWDAASTAKRKLAGSGIGVRSIWDGWSFDASVAWRSQGGASTAEDVDRNPRVL
jgi:hemolysin activation/secretion protein